MAFFDRKEDVLDLELTPHGKFLLSMGKFKPAYYAFYDDDILYDWQWGGTTEDPRDAHKRIKEETPRIRTQASIESVEGNINKLNRQIRSYLVQNEKTDDTDHKFQTTIDRHYNLVLPMGTSDNVYSEFPAWNVRFLKGEIFGTATHFTNPYQAVRIPQLPVKSITYNSRVQDSSVTNAGSQPDEEFNLNCDPAGNILNIFPPAAGNIFPDEEDPSFFPDGSSITIEGNSLVLEISEDNTLFQNENFDIEVFREETDVNGKNILVPLYFEEESKEIKDGILLDRDDLEPDFRSFDPTFVSHYFELLVDEEIPDSVLEELLPEGQTFGVLSKRIFEKKDSEDKRTIGNVYADDYHDDVELCKDEAEDTE